MITRLTQRYKVTCDRCGRETYCDETRPTIIHEVVFGEHSLNLPYRSGHACDECYKDFCEIAELFFNESNRVTDYTETLEDIHDREERTSI